jgi:tRNA(Ile)-lysidine synthetase-like protein
MKPSLNLNENLLDKSKSYLVAVSFGPDSMALLFSLLNLGYQVEVAHVNYHQRDVSDFEQAQLEQVCLQHDIPLHILDVQTKPKGNFQDQARTIRYHFFKEVAIENHLTAIITAHHADDDLETATMQIKRQSLHDYYGIRPQSDWQGTPVIRPLLQTFKSTILQFCNEMKIGFSLDASNEKPIYTRNKIRLSLSGLTENEKQIQLKTIQQRNLTLEKKMVEVAALSIGKRITLTQYLNLDPISQFLFWLSKSKHEGIHFPITQAFLQKIQTVCLSKKPNLRVTLVKGWWFEKAYDDGWIIAKTWLKPYRMHTNDSAITLALIQFDFKFIPKEFQDCIVRSARGQDQIQIKDYKKTFRRLAIDWKIPLFLREIWPVVTNTQGKILTIPRYQKKLANQANNWFEILE